MAATATDAIPFGWLAPGEIRWCAACGRKLVWLDMAVCWRCEGAKTGDLRFADSIRHVVLKHDAIRRAWERIEAGVPRLFWMDGAI